MMNKNWNARNLLKTTHICLNKKPTMNVNVDATTKTNNMQIITAPKWESPTEKITLFLGGGISNCPDWQNEFIKMLKPLCLPISIFNPRRDNFDTSNSKESQIQINWEHWHLNMSNIVLFWFPHETLCPITLFEYGKYLAYSTTIKKEIKLVVGCHPDYARRFDIVYQTRLENPNITIYNNLSSMVNAVYSHVKNS
jgi:Nucleoside 2-deoxyribosyltransferase like